MATSNSDSGMDSVGGVDSVGERANFAARVDRSIRAASDAGPARTTSGLLELYIADSISSTMDWARGGIAPAELEGQRFFSQAYEVGGRTNPALQVFVAREQNAGRGREGRRWLSAHDAGVWMTVKTTLAVGTDIQGLSLAAGVGVVRAIKQLTRAGADDAEIVLKWPNDVGLFATAPPPANQRNNAIFRKIAGVLCESQQEQGAIISGPKVLIGVGLNIYNTPQLNSVSGCALEELVGETPELYFRALGALAVELLAVIGQFQAGGFSRFLGDVRVYSLALNGRRVKGGQVSGIVRGIADDGALLVESAPGKRERCYSGEVTIDV